MSAEQGTSMGPAHPNNEGGLQGQIGVEASLDRKGSLLRVTLQDVPETTHSSGHPVDATLSKGGLPACRERHRALGIRNVYDNMMDKEDFLTSLLATLPLSLWCRAGADGVFERQLLLELHNKTHFTAAELDAMIRHFREDSIAGSDQYVDRESFQQYLGYAFGEQDEELMDHLFFAMDRQQQGRVKVKHLVMALSTIFRGGEDEVLEFWFKMYDADQNGRLTKAEFESLLNDVNGTMKKNLALEMEVLYGEEDSDEGQPVELDMEEFKHIMGGLGVLPSFMSPHKASSDSQTILFRDFTPSEREVLSLLGSVRKLQHGDYIIREKDRQCRFFLITQGIVELSRGGIRLQVQEEGEFLGEAALFDDVKTLHSDGSVKFTTSAKVVSPEAMVLEMHIKDFYQLVYHEHPGATQIVQRLGRVMMERFEQTEERLQSLLASSPHQSQAGMRLSSKDWQQFRQRLTRLWSLRYHKIGRKGKLEILPTKQMGSKQDLSVAYSPGVAEPCLSIKKDAEWAFEYTAKGHLVGVITNGTAVLGLGDIGPLAAKPVMEGKAVLFKKFADIDAFDLELDCKDPERLVDHVVALGPSFGGINLEDIKAPECFMVERECQRRLTIPVFHDDQHGTAIIAGAGLINALQLVDKEIDSIKVVVCGVGAAGFTCAKYFVALGVLPENLYAVDVKGVVYKGREDLEEPDNYLKEVANDTPLRTLQEAVAGADVFLGLSAGGLLKPEMLQSMERDPIVFACANPIPEIDPVTAKQTRPDVIIATGRSDFPNQINNVCAFPYIFRGALDCRARAVNEQMKLAATKAIASLVHTPLNSMKRSLSTQSMSDEQRRRHRRSNTMGLGLDDDEQQQQQELAADDSLSLSMRTMKLDPVFDRDYIIPKPFDERLIVEVSCAVVEAAITSGVARRKDMDLQSYRAFLMDLTTKQAI